MHVSRILPLFLLAFVCGRSHVSAEPIPILVTGAIFLGTAPDDSFMTLRGEGLEIPYWSEYIFPPSLAVTCKPCQPGQSVNLSEHDRLAENVYGTINLGGVSVFFDRADLGFDIRAGNVTLGEASTTTFLFLGRLTGIAEGGMAFERTLIGSGTASAWLDSEFVGHFQGSTSYDFDQAAPVPEPAMLILFGTGLASLTFRLRRGGRRRAVMDPDYFPPSPGAA